MKLHFVCALPLVACLIISLVPPVQVRDAPNDLGPVLELRPEQELLIIDPAAAGPRPT